MGVYKSKLIFISTFFVVCFIVSCSSGSSNENVNSLLQEIDDLKKDKNEAVVLAKKSMDDITSIYEELDRVNSSLGYIRINVNNEVAVDRSKVKEVDGFISNIKQELRKVKEKGGISPEVVKRLTATIEKKEKEIRELKSQINRLENELSAQRHENADQRKTITSQSGIIQDQSQQISRQQAKQWHDMGLLLYNISADFEEGSNVILGLDRGNKNKIKANKKKILTEAKRCFTNAVQMGILESSKYIATIDAEIKKL